MKNRKFTWLFLVMLLMLSMNSVTVQAASKNSLKKVKGISWDLKKGKKTTIHIYYMGIGTCNETVQITSLKVKKTPGKKNYMTATVKLIFDETWNITPAQVDKVLRATRSANKEMFGAPIYCYAVDYNTGVNLEKKNSLKVKVKDDEMKSYGQKTYYGLPTWYDQNGKRVTPYVKLSKLAYTVSITYPKKYDGLCLLAGGCTRLKEDYTQNDTNFTEGKGTFRKAAAFYSNSDKKFCHGIRIRAKK